MTICRFYLQGNCRYGDRCRFEHADYETENYTSNRNKYSSPERYNDRRHTGQWNEPNSYGSYNRNERPEYENYHRNQRYESPDRYQNPRSKFGLENFYGNNKYQWLSPEYTKQLPHQPRSRFSGDVGPNVTSSTPKSNASFSFRVPESEIKKIHPGTNINEQNQVYADLIREDALAWENGKQWPFTCYFPFTGKAAFPGFNDISPEELRCEAYQAKENNSYETYITAVEKTLLEVKEKRHSLLNPTNEILSIVSQIENGQIVSSQNTTVNNNFGKVNTFFTQQGDNEVESMNEEEIATLVKSAASSFSFRLPSEDSQKPSVFGAPSPVAPFGAPSLKQDSSEIYTRLDKLSAEDKEQFTCSTFTLGKIPPCPPPQELCF